MLYAIMDVMNNFFKTLLDALPVHPYYYYGLFPLLSYEEVVAGYENGLFPHLSGLAPSLTYCVLLSVARYFLQHYVVNHLALWCMKLKRPKFTPHPGLEKQLPYKKKVVYEPKQIEDAAKELRLQASEVNRYLTRRAYFHVVNKKIVKFVEAFWRAGFYAAFTYVGYRTLFTPERASWIQDTSNNFVNWPNHPLLPSILFYYNVELGCYFHQLLWTDRNHSDALEMTIHHFVTIALIIASFLSNFHRIGTTILLVHDVSDVFLETAKVFNYTSKPPSHQWIKPVFVDGIFAIFAITFFVTRLMIYPYYVLGSVYTTAWDIFHWTFFGAYVYTFLLFSLQILHIFWFYLISKMIYKLVFETMEGDVRSDDEYDEEIKLEEVATEEEEKQKQDEKKKVESKKEK